MNVADSQLVTESLVRRGFQVSNRRNEADLVIVNTCSVREKAEQRAIAHIREIAARKRKYGSPRAIWVIGCMAQRKGPALKEEVPGIDLVIGAPEIEYIEEYLDSYIAQSRLENGPLGSAKDTKVSTFVPVTRGCDNFCTYCIVPHVRGREHSVPAQTVYNEISRSVEQGTTEVTLLGQNVNSYRDGDTDFPSLLKMIHAIDGLERIRFTTSHPKDCTEELIATVAQLPKCAKHIHLPIQSGSGQILSLMNRHYTPEHYLDLVTTMRRHMPEVDITTDILVGFPGETYEDFRKTVDLMQTVRFTSAFMFAYSPRPGTMAADRTETISPEEKHRRLEEVIALQTQITKEHFARMVGKTVRVLLSDQREDGMWMGQDAGCKNVLVSCSDCHSGMILDTTVVRSSGMTLLCERTTL